MGSGDGYTIWTHEHNNLELSIKYMNYRVNSIRLRRLTMKMVQQH